jgi:hypothetical protein
MYLVFCLLTLYLLDSVSICFDKEFTEHFQTIYHWPYAKHQPFISHQIKLECPWNKTIKAFFSFDNSFVQNLLIGSGLIA